MTPEQPKRPQEDQAPLFPGARLGVYEIVSLLGAGGMGQVYRAFDTKLRRAVAVKVLADGASGDTAAKRLLHEARLACALNHPNICTVHEVSEVGNLAFIVQEFIEGRSLSELIPPKGLPFEQVLKYGRQIAEATAHAHSKGVVHRDLKSANIIVTPPGRIKVLDFGIARRLPNVQPDAVTDRKSSLEQAGAIAGTLPYMAPETLRGEVADERTDIWALGIILFEMATGDRPFHGRTTFELSEEILHKPVPPLRPSHPPSLRAPILRCLAKERDERYQRAAELRAALEVLESSAGIAVRAPARGLASEARRWAPVAFVAVVAAIAVGVAGWFFSGTAGRQSTASSAAESVPSLESLTVTQLTSSGDVDSPALSPDGRYVAYLSQGGQPPRRTLLVRQMATGSTIQVAVAGNEESLFGPTITPDGAFVEFVRYSLPAQTGALWRVALLGGQETKIADDVVSAAWAPDGRQIAFLRRSLLEKRTHLIVADTVGDRERTLRTRTGPEAFTTCCEHYLSHNRPAWSPDGKSIALLAHASRGDVIDVVDSRTGAVRSIPTDFRVGTNVAWLDDSNLVVNGQTADVEISQLWRISLADGRVSRITNDLSDYITVSVTADGNTLVTTRVMYRFGLWLGDRAGRRFTVAVPPNEEHGTPDVFWAGDRLLFITAPTGISQLLAYVPGAPLQQVTTSIKLEPGARSDLAGSPSGRVLLGTREGLIAVDPDGRRASALLAGRVPFDSIRPTLDGRVFVTVTSPSGTVAIWTVPMNGGEATKITEGADLLSAAPSPDGTKLLVEKRAQKNFHTYVVCDLPHCSAERPVRLPGNTFSARWFPHSRSIAYSDLDSKNLWTLPWDGDRATQLTFFTDGYAINNFEWSLDGKQLAIGRGKQFYDVVLFKGLKR